MFERYGYCGRKSFACHSNSTRTLTIGLMPIGLAEIQYDTGGWSMSGIDGCVIPPRPAVSRSAETST